MGCERGGQRFRQYISRGGGGGAAADLSGDPCRPADDVPVAGTGAKEAALVFGAWDVKADTRNLDSTEAFFKGLNKGGKEERRGPFGGGGMSLKSFAQQRRAFLLGVPEIAKAKWRRAPLRPGRRI
jgi:hypothetical protein